jgi:hypothetical protein
MKVTIDHDHRFDPLIRGSCHFNIKFDLTNVRAHLQQTVAYKADPVFFSVSHKSVIVEHDVDSHQYNFPIQRKQPIKATIKESDQQPLFIKNYNSQ